MSEAISISGNPTDDEIAAISAAYSFLVTSTVDRPVDNHRPDSRLWQKAFSGNDLDRSLAVGQTRDWVNAHRLLSR